MTRRAHDRVLRLNGVDGWERRPPDRRKKTLSLGRKQRANKQQQKHASQCRATLVCSVQGHAWLRFGASVPVCEAPVLFVFFFAFLSVVSLRLARCVGVPFGCSSCSKRTDTRGRKKKKGNEAKTANKVPTQFEWFPSRCASSRPGVS